MRRSTCQSPSLDSISYSVLNSITTSGEHSKNPEGICTCDAEVGNVVIENMVNSILNWTPRVAPKETLVHGQNFALGDSHSRIGFSKSAIQRPLRSSTPIRPNKENCTPRKYIADRYEAEYERTRVWHSEEKQHAQKVIPIGHPFFSALRIQFMGQKWKAYLPNNDQVISLNKKQPKEVSTVVESRETDTTRLETSYELNELGRILDLARNQKSNEFEQSTTAASHAESGNPAFTVLSGKRQLDSNSYGDLENELKDLNELFARELKKDVDDNSRVESMIPFNKKELSYNPRQVVSEVSTASSISNAHDFLDHASPKRLYYSPSKGLVTSIWKWIKHRSSITNDGH
ncbi:unnamed protein product [Caenorhabditis auriculariae]|uniref:Uncharacterized protein n=1 Tax=Caenorhabditis auriculariae TaxID=2777116 RepID=A0A8S1HWA2_9PELO|nr:unnamed protein product [Caenorhabditis auriculariae]